MGGKKEIESVVIGNKSNKQYFHKINENDILNAQKFVNNLGGEKEVNNIVNVANFVYIHNNVISESYDLLFRAANLPKDKARILIFTDKNQTYGKLKLLRDSQYLDRREKTNLELLIKAIEKYINF